MQRATLSHCNTLLHPCICLAAYAFQDSDDRMRQILLIGTSHCSTLLFYCHRGHGISTPVHKEKSCGETLPDHLLCEVIHKTAGQIWACPVSLSLFGSKLPVQGDTLNAPSIPCCVCMCSGFAVGGGIYSSEGRVGCPFGGTSKPHYIL